MHHIGESNAGRALARGLGNGCVLAMDVDLQEKCPCGATLKFTMTDVARGKTVRCPRGHSVKLVDDGGGARMAKKSMDDLDKSLSKLNKTIKLKI